ncbi:MAG: sulfatase-like hydrolase/transferase [bacterium]
MNRRAFLKTTGIGLMALTLPKKCVGASDDTPAKQTPNIIFILSDDVGLSEIGCCGGDHYKTPNIDALAQTGTRFEYSYSTPLCGPSRCQALTGRYPFRTGLISNQSHNAVNPGKEVMLPTVMKKAGYATAAVGKWGQICLGPGEWGFDEYLSFKGSGRYWASQSPSYVVNGQAKELSKAEYLPDVMHNFLVDFITRNQAKPFYVHYAISHMHGPILRTPDSKAAERGEGALYADNVAYMDKLVGKIVAELDRLHLREKTLIVFTGDNGTARFGADKSTLGGRPVNGHKATMLEGGSRVPLIVNWPGTAPAGKVNRDLTDFSDFFSTFAQLAGAALPAGVVIDGQSFAAQIKGEKGQPREWVYVELNGKSYVRNSRFKLTNGGDLFDLKDAPFNEIPVPADSAEAEAVTARKRLKEILDQHRAAPGIALAPKKKQQKSAKKDKKQ